MFTTRIFRHLVWGALVLGASHAQGQSAILGHNGGTGDHLVWDALTPQALEVRHDGDFPIDWYTNAIHRMRLNPSWTTTIGAFPPQDASGYLGLCPTGTIWNGNPGPFSRLHLSDGTTPQQGSHRPWMRNGIAFMGNRDHGYLGQKANGADNTDMVLHWSDNPGVAFKDRLRFIFTSGYSANDDADASSEEGCEYADAFVMN